MKKLINRLSLTAFLLSVIASLYIAFSTVEVHSITATLVPGEEGNAIETVTGLRWFQVQGAWGIFVLVVAALLYAGGYLLARKGAAFWLAVYWVGLLVLTYLAGLSIGLYYVPALVVLLIAAGLLIFEKSKLSSADWTAP